MGRRVPGTKYDFVAVTSRGSLPSHFFYKHDMNYEYCCARDHVRVISYEIDASFRLSRQVAADLREHMEIVHTSEYPSFISSLLRCFVELLKNRLPVQASTCTQ